MYSHETLSDQIVSIVEQHCIRPDGLDAERAKCLVLHCLRQQAERDQDVSGEASGSATVSPVW